MAAAAAAAATGGSSAAVAAATAAIADEQIVKAVQALKKFVAKKAAAEAAASLFDEDPFIYLQLALTTMPAKSSPKPRRIQLPHPLYDANESEICLIVKDHEGEGHKEAKKRIKEAEPESGIDKIIGISKLRKNYKVHEQRRQLAASYDIFLADERVLPSLPRLLGKTFFQKKKQPIPINLTRKSWRTQVKAALDATYYFIPEGTTLVVRAARISFDDDDAVENVRSIINSLVCGVPKKWKNVKAFYLKTIDSVALPIYQSLPPKPTKIKI